MSIRFKKRANAKLQDSKVTKHGSLLSVANGYLIVPYEVSSTQDKGSALAVFNLNDISSGPLIQLPEPFCYEIPHQAQVHAPVLHTKRNILALAPYNFSDILTQHRDAIQIRRPSSKLDPIDQYELQVGESCYVPVVSWDYLFTTTNKDRGLLWSLKDKKLHLLREFLFRDEKPLRHASLHNTIVVEGGLLISCETGFYSIDLEQLEQDACYWDLSPYLDLAKGDTLYTKPTLDEKENTLYFGSRNGRLLKINSTTKQPSWSAEQSQIGERIDSSPIITRKHLYVACKTADREYQVRKISKESGDVLASYTTGEYGKFTAPLVSYGPYILATCGTDMARILVLRKWNLSMAIEHLFETRSAAYTPPIIWNDLICIANRKGEIQVLQIEEHYPAKTKTILRSLIIKHLNPTEIKFISQDLELESGRFDNGRLDDLVIEIINECQRKQQLTQLISYLYEEHEILQRDLEIYV